jgi:CheY-like chemotaxis protein
MKPLLLVVENDSGTRRLLDVFLTRQSFEVDPVAGGAEALLLLEHVDYAAVVLDLLIPGRTGGDVLEELAARSPALLDRIVVISSATEARLRDVRGRYPAVTVLRKPFDLTELLDAVSERAARRVRPSDAAQTFVRRSVTAGARAGAVMRGDTLDVVTSFGEHHTPLLPPLANEAMRNALAVWVPTPVGLAAVPLFGGERVAGVAGWSFAEPRMFSDDERARFAAIAADAAELLHGA